MTRKASGTLYNWKLALIFFCLYCLLYFAITYNYMYICIYIYIYIYIRMPCLLDCLIVGVSNTYKCCKRKKNLLWLSQEKKIWEKWSYTSGNTRNADSQQTENSIHGGVSERYKTTARRIPVSAISNVTASYHSQNYERFGYRRS